MVPVVWANALPLDPCASGSYESTMRRMVALLAAATGALATVGACSSDNVAGSSICDRVAKRLSQCKLDFGKLRGFGCGRSYTSCFSECLTSASCEDLAAFYCTNDATLPARCNCPSSKDAVCTNSGKQVPMLRCNGVAECENGKDEEGCRSVTCGDGTVVPEVGVCNALPDCADGSDEPADCWYRAKDTACGL